MNDLLRIEAIVARNIGSSAGFDLLTVYLLLHSLEQLLDQIAAVKSMRPPPPERSTNAGRRPYQQALCSLEAREMDSR
jgi:hypothetical protein